MPWDTKSLLVVTAALEASTGIALLGAPSMVSKLLLGAGLGSPESQLVGRIAGAALLSIGVICWQRRKYGAGAQAGGVIAGLLTYNLAVLGLLLHAGVVDEMRGAGMWPATGLHLTLSIWCGARLRR